MQTTTHGLTKIVTDSETTERQAEDLHISILIDQLASRSAVERERAREFLVDLGAPAVGKLAAAAHAPNEHQCLEACKALAEIADAASIPALIRALESHHQNVRWVAAEGLANIGSEAVAPLLIAMIYRAGAHIILEGAYHVLHAFARRCSEPIFEPVMAAIRGPHPGANVPPAAEHALMRWRSLSMAASDKALLRTPWRRYHKPSLPRPPL